MGITLTVFFEEPFYVGLVEQTDGAHLRAAKHTFGAEPSDQQVCDWVMAELGRLRLSPSVPGAAAKVLAANPKRRQRQAARAVDTPIGTKSQQALSAAREAAKVERDERAKERREQEAARQFQLRQEKKKARHRGH